ncbi:SMP-30/gluconolactonase/LRE family protein [Phyllobacterium sp. 21LDTY02-6]|uniref:SMP-30/gluconolactonase/LRE family protein n=1 Tax=Phyllobacterium sp. 21LDTY02-6 TaxID=2944903 RepID=UPI0020216CF5|nr:SMP-30/gluconolactonase/LRE family protein [Phyllobacterium sp. 21LDTY02-6]MCO4319408.1 SMP-30/gluconolactonase/LRE family protein [Phyllobacterium sp. 21LDTY02-6]
MTDEIGIFHDEACELGEGPGYDPLTGNVWWFDIVTGRLFEKPLSGGAASVHELGQMASALAIVDANRQLISTETGLFLRDRRSGALTMHQPIEADNPSTRSNDARVHPAGAFWIGTMGKKAEKGAGSIYWYRQGELRKLFADMTITNSICFAPDGRTAYFADTGRNIIWRVETDAETGLPSGEPVVFHEHREKGGVDGAVVDAEGNLWNACWGRSAVDIYAPTGQRIRTIDLPVQQTSCPAFVSETSGDIIVTTAFQDMSANARRGDPDAGKTLLVKTEGKGRLDPPVRL